MGNRKIIKALRLSLLLGYLLFVASCQRFQDDCQITDDNDCSADSDISLGFKGLKINQQDLYINKDHLQTGDIFIDLFPITSIFDKSTQHLLEDAGFWQEKNVAIEIIGQSKGVEISFQRDSEDCYSPFYVDTKQLEDKTPQKTYFIDLSRPCSLKVIFADKEYSFLLIANRAIESEEAFFHIYDHLDGVYFLTVDIYLSKAIQPIGSKQQPFSGLFDGAGYNIHVGHISNREMPNQYIALFGHSYQATIKNLGVLLDESIFGQQQVAGLVGYAQLTHIKNSFVRGSKIVGSLNVGGLVGKAQHVLIEGCFVDVPIYALENSHNLGGLVGYLADSYIVNSYASASSNIVLDAASLNAGGLVGYVVGGNTEISDVYALNSLQHGNYVGGLIGKVELATTDDLLQIDFAFSNNLVQPNAGDVFGGIFANVSQGQIILNEVFYATSPAVGIGLIETNYTGLINNEINFEIEGSWQYLDKDGLLPQLLPLEDWHFSNNVWFLSQESPFDKYKLANPADPWGFARLSVDGLEQAVFNQEGLAVQQFIDINPEVSGQQVNWPRLIRKFNIDLNHYNAAVSRPFGEEACRILNSYNNDKGQVLEIDTSYTCDLVVKFNGNARIVELVWRNTIADAQQLQAIEDNLADSFILKNNIMLSNWQPIGSVQQPFSGDFDGNGFVISFLPATRTINDLKTLSDDQALFGYVSQAAIKNIGLDLAGTEIIGQNYVAPLASHVENSIVSNCYAINGRVYGNSYVGGLLSEVKNSQIMDCFSAVNLFHIDDYKLLTQTNATAQNTVAANVLDHSTPDNSSVDNYAVAENFGGLIAVGTDIKLLRLFFVGNIICHYVYANTDSSCQKIGSLLGSVQGHKNTINSSYGVSSILGKKVVGDFIGYVNLRDEDSRLEVIDSYAYNYTPVRQGPKIGNVFGLVEKGSVAFEGFFIQDYNNQLSSAQASSVQAGFGQVFDNDQAADLITSDLNIKLSLSSDDNFQPSAGFLPILKVPPSWEPPHKKEIWLDFQNIVNNLRSD